MSGKKGQMARRLVYYCIGVLTMVTVWAVVVKTTTPSIDLADVLTFVSVVFGGELLMLLIKRVFSKPTETEEIKDGTDYDERPFVCGFDGSDSSSDSVSLSDREAGDH